MRVIQCIYAYAAESGHAPAVSVVGSLCCKDILNELSHTSLVGVCVCTSYKCNKFVAVVIVFPVATKFTTF
jgi:hypothetical protein